MTADRVLGLAALALAAGYYAMAAAIPVSTLADAVGPAGLPKIYGVALGVLGVALLVQSGLGTRDSGLGERSSGLGARDSGLENSESPNPESRIPNPDTASPNPDRNAVAKRIAGLLAIGVLYIALVPSLGYLLSIALLIAATTYYQGGGLNGRVALVALGGAVLFWLLFVRVLSIPQPPGVWPSFL